MDIFKTITEGLGKLFGFIDNVHTSDEEKLSLKVELLQVQAGLLDQALVLEKASLDAASAVVQAEATSDSWLTANWRPITALVFASMVVYAFVTGQELPAEMWATLQIMIGGYVASRGAEKIVPGIVKALKAKEQI